MKKISANILFITILISFFATAKQVSANTTVNIIIETDTEERIDHHQITCKRLSLKKDLAHPEEIEEIKLTSNQEGIATLDISSPSDIYQCKSSSVLTDDYCWYFPYLLTIQNLKNSDHLQPVYLIGLASKNTCGKELTNSDLDNITQLLPSGTPAPFQNSNVQTPKTINQPTQSNDSTPETKPSFFEWLITKIKELFT